MRLKRLDAMLIKGFIPPFLLSFLMALFVLVLQVFWLYIDDILGKGVGVFVILEFLFYLSFSLVPLALPIGVLLAGVFLFGNLGEQYELASMKTAGISLLRIMLPLAIFSFCIAVFSFVCSEFIIPNSNLKYISRLHDIKRQKPTLALDEAIFNNDFYGYTIRIGQRDDNGTDIRDILIYDHSKADTRELTIISAKEGRMYVTSERKHLVMELETGYVYQNPGSSGNPNARYPFITISFNNLVKIFDLSEFELDRTDEDLFKNDRKMKNSRQLVEEIDSFSFKLKEPIVNELDGWIDPAHFSKENRRTQHMNRNNLSYYSLNNTKLMDSLFQSWVKRDSSFYSYHKPAVQRSINLDISRLESKVIETNQILKQKARAEYELYLKSALAFVCFMFLFIGAPLGAIVRKGGYGYPLIICILVFVFYILMNTFCKRLAEGLRIEALLGAWLPCIILVIPSLLLSWSALRDRNVFDDIRLMLKRLTA